jgi:hypothetical protein
MFSRRLPDDLEPTPLACALQAAVASGRPLLDLTAATPARSEVTPEGRDAARVVAEALADGSRAPYAPDPRGLVSAREAIAADYALRGIEVDPDDVFITCSTSEAYALIFKLLCDPGDEVLAARPSYPLFDMLARLDAVTLRAWSLTRDVHWHVDRASVEEVLSARARALLVVSPNNPTGSYPSASDHAWLDGLAARRDMALVCDEVFADYPAAAQHVASDRDLPSVLRAPARALTFVLSGLSKVLGLPHLKLAWAVLRGPATLRAEARRRLDVIADAYLSASTPVQVALPRLLALRPTFQAALRSRLDEAEARLRRALAATPAVEVLPRQGGWYAVLRLPRIMTDEEWTLALMQKHSVLVQPGFFFDFDDDGYLVLSLTGDPRDVESGASRIATCVAHHLGSTGKPT